MNINLDEISIKEIKKGYQYSSQDGCYICTVCGKTFEDGEVYAFGSRFFESSRAVLNHINQEHGDYFEKLIEFDSKYVSFTDNQKELLNLIHSGMTDNDIAKKLGISPSTVRHQKFMFREKAKQAKMYLSIYELAIEKKPQHKDTILPVHNNAKMVDDRYITTVDERDKILESVFESLSPLKLKVFSAKEKKKIVTLTKIAEQFEKDRSYSEAEVNQILKNIYEDYATLRRYLIEYGFMERTKNCKEYWLK